MPREFEGWIILIFFVVIPVLRWIFERVLATVQSSGKPGQKAKKRVIEEEEPLPEWFEGQVWETVSDPEDVRELAPTTKEPEVQPSIAPLPAIVSTPSRSPSPPRRPRLTPGHTAIQGLKVPPVSSIIAPPGASAPSAVPESTPLLSRPFSRQELQRAVLFSEILGKPRALEPFSSGGEGSSA